MDIPISSTTVFVIIAFSFILLLALWWSQNINNSNSSLATFSSSLNPSNEVPPITNAPMAMGLTTGNLTTNRNIFNYNVTVQGLSGPPIAAHLHRAPTGQNGPIVKTLNLQPLTSNGMNIWRAQGQWTNIDTEPLTNTLANDLLNGNIYVNVHTQLNPNGEVRGQLHTTKL